MFNIVFKSIICVILLFNFGEIKKKAAKKNYVMSALVTVLKPSGISLPILS